MTIEEKQERKQKLLQCIVQRGHLGVPQKKRMHGKGVVVLPIPQSRGLFYDMGKAGVTINDTEELRQAFTNIGIRHQYSDTSKSVMVPADDFFKLCEHYGVDVSYYKRVVSEFTKDAGIPSR